MTPEAQEELRAIAKTIAQVCGEGVGYALFLATGPETSYVSNGHRADVLTMLEEWLRKTAPATLAVDLKDGGRAGRSFTTKLSSETSQQVDVRLTLERRCADLGKQIGEVTKLCLFMFDFGERGNVAYFENIPDAHGAIRRWVEMVRGRS